MIHFMILCKTEETRGAPALYIRPDNKYDFNCLIGFYFTIKRTEYVDFSDSRGIPCKPVYSL